MKQYKLLSALLLALKTGRAVLPAGYELVVESRGPRITRQDLIPIS